MNDIKNLGLIFGDSIVIEDYYQKLKSIFIKQLSDPTTGLFLDIGALPTSPLDIKSAVVKWLISVNLERIKQHQEPVFDLRLVLKCPVWNFVKPPLRRIQLTPEKMFNQKTKSGQGFNSAPKIKGINKR